jgi:hypothetical protein
LSTASKFIVLFAIIISIGLGLVVWNTYGKSGPDFSVITTEEIEAFLRDASPEFLQELENDPKQLEERLEGLKELFSLAAAAKYKFKDQPEVMHSLEIIEMLTWATTWDKEKHKDVGPMPPFGFITEEQINDFWGEGQSSTSSATVKLRQGIFDRVVKTQFAMAKRTKRIDESVELDEETKNTLRPEFTKIKIYEEEAKAAVAGDPQKWGWLTARVSFQAKLQQAQFLAGLLTEDLSKQLEVTDDEVKDYIAKNPDVGDLKGKKAKAEELIKKLDAGADFAELAKEFSEDPGSGKDGGMIKDATLGSLVPQYEKAALALKPGEYTKTPVESQFGYHVIKLEKKEEIKNDKGGTELKYDSRHILISTRISDPSNPFSMPLSVEQFVKGKIQEEKREKLLEGIKKKYPVTIQSYKIPKAKIGDTQPAPPMTLNPAAEAETKK